MLKTDYVVYPPPLDKKSQEKNGDSGGEGTHPPPIPLQRDSAQRVLTPSLTAQENVARWINIKIEEIENNFVRRKYLAIWRNG